MSAAALFLEMVLIRWVAAEVRIFAYMHNLLLIACFFGIGLGCFRAAHPPQWTRALWSLAMLAFLVTDPLQLDTAEMATQGMAVAHDTVVWFAVGGRGCLTSGLLMLTALLVTFLLIVLVVFSLEPFGQVLGASLAAHPRPLAAYSANLVGSLAGT